MKAVILTRVSSKEQEEGHSLPAQNARLIEYAKRKNLEVIRTFQIIESSTRGKRKEFMTMINFCKQQKETIAIVCDNIDRLQRSFRESVLLDDLIRKEIVELHFFREGMVIGKSSTSTDIMRWDFGVMGAKAYVLQLSENVRRSLEYKLNNGEIIGPAPCGYENYINEYGKHSIRKKEPEATYLKNLFELYSIGGTSIHQLTKMANDYGIRSRMGNKLGVTSMIVILDNPFYYGEMLAKGRLHRHIYDPLITKELWDACQEQRKLQTTKPFNRGEIPFLYRGIFTDYNKQKTCPCEIKKKKFVYVVCYKENGTRIYVPEYVIDKQVEDILDDVAVPEQAISDFKEYIKLTKQAELDYQKAELERIDTKLKKIDQRMTVLFNMRLDQEITKDEYETKRDEYKLERSRLELLKNAHHLADDGFNETVLNMFDLLTSAKNVFKSSTSNQNKQLLLHFIFEKLELKEGVISYKLKSPFCYTKTNSSVSSMSPVSTKNAKNWELIENTELNGKYSAVSGNFEEDVCEPRVSVENKGLPTYFESTVQYGCLTWIRTKINGVRVRCPTIRRSSNIINANIDSMLYFKCQHFLYDYIEKLIAKKNQ